MTSGIFRNSAAAAIRDQRTSRQLIYKQSANIKCISDLVRDLESRPVLAEMCGFNAGKVPDASPFSRFLGNTNNAEIEKLFHASGKLLVESKAASLDVIIADSKPIKANTTHNNPKNPSRTLDKTSKIKRNPMATIRLLLISETTLRQQEKRLSLVLGLPYSCSAQPGRHSPY